MSSCGHCSWAKTGSISRARVARSRSSLSSSTAVSFWWLLGHGSQKPCLLWKLPGYWGLVGPGVPGNNKSSGTVCMLELQRALCPDIDNAALSPKTRLSHPHCKVFTVLQLILLLGGNEEMQARLVARDANGHLPTSLLAGRNAEVPKSCKCSAWAQKEPSQRSALLAHAALHGQMALGSELTHAHLTQRQAKHAGS